MSSNTVNNLGLYDSGTYFPFICNISAVSTGSTTTVTTSVDHGFVIGNAVQFFIPPSWGIQQLDGLKAIVLATTDDTITVNINSQNFNSLITPSPVIENAQVAPIGDYNSGYSITGINNPVLQIPGTYRNTFP